MQQVVCFPNSLPRAVLGASEEKSLVGSPRVINAALALGVRRAWVEPSALPLPLGRHVAHAL